jgi:AcrR family transcriptional regulator
MIKAGDIEGAAQRGPLDANRPRRPYRSERRAEAAARTHGRILDAVGACLQELWFEEVSIAQVAARAGVTSRTVIRHFGGKTGLMTGFANHVAEAANRRRIERPGDIDAAVERLFEAYESDGGTAIRGLAQEDRHPLVRAAVEAGRVAHREVTAANFAPWLTALPEPERLDLLDALVVVTDIYAWKVLRQDLGRSELSAKRRMKALVEAVLSRQSNAAA